jgi:hypothetical protein
MNSRCAHSRIVLCVKRLPRTCAQRHDPSQHKLTHVSDSDVSEGEEGSHEGPEDRDRDSDAAEASASGRAPASGDSVYIHRMRCCALAIRGSVQLRFNPHLGRMGATHPARLLFTGAGWLAGT